MATDVEKLVVSLEAKVRGFENALNKANRTAQTQLKKIEGQFTATNKKLTLNMGGFGKSSFASAFSGLQSQLLTIVAPVALVTAAIGGAKKALADFGKLADDIKPTGLSPEIYQGLGLGAREAGVEQDQLNAALNVFAKNAGLAAVGAGPLVSGLQKLNPELLKAIQSAKTQDERLRLVADALGSTGDAAERAAISATVFGKAGVKLVDIFAQGSKGIDEFIKRGHDMGVIISGEMLSNVDALSDKLDVLQFAIQTNLNQALINLAPSLVDAATEIARLTKGVKDFTEQPSFETFVKMLELTNPHIVAAAQNVDKLVASLKDGEPAAKKLADGIKEAVADIPRDMISPAAIASLDALVAKFGESGEGAADVKRKLEELAKSNPEFIALAERLNPLLDKLIDIQKQAGVTGAAVSQSFRQSENASMDALGGMNAERDKFIGDRNADASRAELEKQIDDRTAAILKAADDVGVSLTEAAARIQAQSEIAAETTVKANDASASSAMDLIKKFEGFITTAKFDVNAYRVGYGSDTVTLSDGSIIKVTQGMTTTLAQANADLSRRIGEFQAGIEGKIGADTFRGMSEQQQAALTSIAYNYGSLPDRIVEAIKTGNTQTVYEAIKGLGSDNGGINKTRRGQEADMFLSGSSSIDQADIKLREDQAKAIHDTIAALSAETATIGFETQAMSMSNAERERARVIREALNELEKQGITITDEVRAAVEAEANARYGQVAAYDEAAAAADRLKQSQEDLAAQQEEINDAFSGALKGFISDLAHGKSLTDALRDAVSKLADRLLDIALDNLFGGGGGGGGLIGKLFGFAEGGYTGNGGTQQPAGVVHGQEFVVNAQATKKNRPLLEAMNAGVPGYASGGFVKRLAGARGGGRNGNMGAANAAGAQGGRPISVAITVNTPDAHSFVESQNQIAARTAAHLERTMRTR
ncbi:lysozyme [Mesorhizobium cantuariense]|uniref:Lysozyme n=1 Tax=Mesorhizobium cantuariense TaxID=1300275 RepID=A0ABV7MLG3_9HYPH